MSTDFQVDLEKMDAITRRIVQIMVDAGTPIAEAIKLAVMS